MLKLAYYDVGLSIFLRELLMKKSNDTFCFGENWGNDTVEQLAGGKITLWFESGEMSNWNADTLTYTDGENSVTVSGVNSVTLKFGNNTALPSGCFDDAASEKIFEDKNKGMLA